ncbi:MAG: HAD family hydrolase [candidate division Zixibacteria bacterium]|nr:HAD family hydrolase [candidate division Zixibacteria bacterium]MDH3936600.1 HAD family hydrolase [candidate division Zixibacteria bacterium]MDH4035245.1 HAD family hydrolase [candidate division Zixibacteria bacterium]
MKTKAVIFDLDDTLIPSVRDVLRALSATLTPVAERYDKAPDELVVTMRSTAREIWRASDLHPYCERVGIASYEGLWATPVANSDEARQLSEWLPEYRLHAWRSALKRQGIEEEGLAEHLAATFPTERRRRAGPFPEIETVLNHLKESYRLALLTNGEVGLQNEKLDLSGLRHHFEVVTVSGEIGIGKPDRQVFDLTLKRLGLTVDAAVMVGDNLRTDISGALGIGMFSAWINRDGRTGDDTIRPDAELADLTELAGAIPNI